MIEGALVAMRGGAADQFQPVGRHGQGEGHGVIGVPLGHGPGRQDDDLVHDRPHRGVGLRPPDDDAVLAAVHNPDVKVRVLLLVGTLASLPFDVGLGHGDAEVPGAAAVELRGDAGGVVRPFFLVQVVGDHRQGEQGVRADGLDDVQDAPGLFGGFLDQLRSSEEVVRVPGEGEIPAVGGVLAVGDHEKSRRSFRWAKRNMVAP